VRASARQVERGAITTQLLERSPGSVVCVLLCLSISACALGLVCRCSDRASGVRPQGFAPMSCTGCTECAMPSCRMCVTSSATISLHMVGVRAWGYGPGACVTGWARGTWERGRARALLHWASGWRRPRGRRYTGRPGGLISFETPGSSIGRRYHWQEPGQQPNMAQAQQSTASHNGGASTPRATYATAAAHNLQARFTGTPIDTL
jgi:hypothetical protein